MGAGRGAVRSREDSVTRRDYDSISLHKTRHMTVWHNAMRELINFDGDLSPEEPRPFAGV